MNNSLIKENAGTVMLVILVVVLILITKNPISNSLFGAVGDYKIFNATPKDLCVCIRTTTATSGNHSYLRVNIPANSSSVLFPGIARLDPTKYSGVILILKNTSKATGITSGSANSPGFSEILNDQCAVCTISGTASNITTSTKPINQPFIKLRTTSFGNVTTRTPTDVRSGIRMATITSGFDFTDMYPNGINGNSNCVVILDAFKITDFSTFTDTGENKPTLSKGTDAAPGVAKPNYYNNLFLTDALYDGELYISRFILASTVGSASEYIWVAKPALLTNPTSHLLRNNSNIYASRPLSGTDVSTQMFYSKYYLPPYIVSPITPATNVPTYSLKYTNVVSDKFANLLTGTNMGTMKFFYGPNTNPGRFTVQDNNYSLVGTTSGAPGTISLTFGAGTVTSTTPTSYEIRYIDTIIDTTGSTTLNFYNLGINGTGTEYIRSGTASSGTPSTNVVAKSTNVVTKSTTVTIKGTNSVNPPFMPYVLEIPGGISVNENTSSTTPINYPSGSTKYIFRSIDNSTNKDNKYVSISGTTSTLVTNLPNARRSV